MARPTHHSTPSIRKPSVPLTRRRRPSTTPTISPAVLLGLRALVVLIVLWYELGTFWWHTSACHWDDSLFSSTTSSKADGKPFHVLMVADPQLLDMRSYPGRNLALRWLGVKVTDAYARKAWRFVIRSRGTNGARVDGVVWLGDLMDSGVDSVEPDECVSLSLPFHPQTRSDT